MQQSIIDNWRGVDARCFLLWSKLLPGSLGRRSSARQWSRIEQNVPIARAASVGTRDFGDSSLSPACCRGSPCARYPQYEGELLAGMTERSTTAHDFSLDARQAAWGHAGLAAL